MISQDTLIDCSVIWLGLSVEILPHSHLSMFHKQVYPQIDIVISRSAFLIHICVKCSFSKLASGMQVEWEKEDDSISVHLQW